MHHCFHRKRRGLRPRLSTIAAAGCMAAIAALAGAPTQAGRTTPDLATLKARYARPAQIPFPADNPYSVVKSDLGRALFFDPRLSGPSTTSCATCHNPALSWGDGLPTGIGSAANKLGRRSPSILNLAWASAMFWDGRMDTLEQQAVGPILAPGEMNQSMPKLLTTLATIPGYRDAFAAAFPREAVSETTIGKAIATFERTVVSAMAPFDLWIEGDETAISDEAKRGFATFNAKANCAACHSGWRFTDDSFHDIGLPDADLGRGNIVEGVEPLKHAFKTPGLRNIAGRGPYMHNGSVRTMTEVIRHYDQGFVQRASLSSEIRALQLTETDVRELVAFMQTLTSKDPAIEVPALPTEAMN
jgi:cytochrome c peroxidase